jgi:hypothetical protein
MDFGLGCDDVIEQALEGGFPFTRGNFGYHIAVRVIIHLSLASLNISDH